MASSNLPALKTEIAKAQTEFAKSLPGHITAEKFVRTAQTAVSLTRNIEKVTNFKSLLTEVSKAAADGLILDGREAALVIDGNGNAQYRPMMRGLLKLAWQSDEIRSLVVDAVRDKDVFDYQPTRVGEPVIHKINLREDRGAVYAFYALAVLKDGGTICEVMSLQDVHRIRDRSDAWRAFKAGKIKSTPWHTDETEMGRKTVFRRLSKYLPSSSDRDAFRQAVERIDDDYSFEADADANGEVSTPKPAAKKRGAAAAALKDVTPKKPQPEPQEDYDRDTGEILEGDYEQTEEDVI